VGAKRALRDVIGWAHSNQATFHQRLLLGAAPRHGLSGQWLKRPDWDSIAFYPLVLKDVLRELGYEPEAILYEWKTREWLDTRPDRRKAYTKQVTLPDGSRPYMIVIQRKFIDEAEAEC